MSTEFCYNIGYIGNCGIVHCIILSRETTVFIINLIQLEKQYAIFFEPQVKTALISRCRDRQSGGLGNFIEILELMISYVRPEWETISYQIIEESGRILHDHTEDIQSYTSIKSSRYDILENEEVENIESVVNAVNIPTTD